MFNLESSPSSGTAARALWPLAGLSSEAETKKDGRRLGLSPAAASVTISVSVLTFFTLKRVLVALAPPGGLPIASHF